MDFGYDKCNGYECYNDRTVFTETVHGDGYVIPIACRL